MANRSIKTTRHAAQGLAMGRTMTTAVRCNQKSPGRPFRRFAGGWAAAFSTGLLCSCASTSLAPPVASVPSQEPGSTVRIGDEASGSVHIAQAAKPVAGAVQQVQFSEFAGAPAAGQSADVQFTAAEPRVPASLVSQTGAVCPPGCPPGCPPYAPQMVPCPPPMTACPSNACAVEPLGVSGPQADEFLCDGGDQPPPVHYDRTFRHGLEPEDTIAEWTDPAGRMHVTPSNKVCVYAPRFGEVRSFATPVGSMRVDRLVSANDFARGAGLNSRVGLDTQIQQAELGATLVRTRASGLANENGLSGFNQATVAALNYEDLPPIVNTAFLRRGEMVRGEEAFLAKGVQAAVIWTRAQYPIISATDVSAQEITSEFRAAEIIGLEDNNKPGKLRIVKLADREVAAQGEEITFTIRYDNLGDKPVHHVRIVDNLTPRLEFVEGSGSSDRAGRLDLEPNGEGSFVLTFVIDEPLPGKTGGVVTFKARVK